MRTRSRRAFDLLAALAVAAASTFLPVWTARAAETPSAASSSTDARAPAASIDRSLDDLAAAEDEKLAEQKAGRWRDGEIVCVVLLLIFLFPIGLIVLVVLALEHHHHH
jgi:hypothetical protein